MEDERDFLSLKLRTSVVEDNKDSVYMRGSGMQWPFANKVSAFMPVSTADTFDANQKSYNSIMQPKNLSIERQGGSHYALGQRIDAQWTHRALENGTFYGNNPSLKTPNTPNRHSFTPVRQSHLGGTPNTGVVAAIVDQRNISKPTSTPAQLTIFYGGSVCVYDNISADKAQAIMNMAGDSSIKNTNMPSPKPQPQPSESSPLGGDVSTSPASGVSSPASITSQANAQSTNGSRSIAATLMSSDVPQARKASLARFLEKRKERTMNATPYNVSAKKEQQPW